MACSIVCTRRRVLSTSWWFYSFDTNTTFNVLILPIGSLVNSNQYYVQCFKTSNCSFALADLWMTNTTYGITWYILGDTNLILSVFLIFNSFTFNSFTKWFLLAQCRYNSPLYFIVFKTIQQHHFHIRTPLMIFFNTTEPRPVLIPSSDVRLIHLQNFQRNTYNTPGVYCRQTMRNVFSV